MKLSRGIEPIIATIIIVAVTLVIAIAVIGWIMGWWGALTGGQESLQIMPDSILDASQKSVALHVKNVGGAAAVIYKVEVSGTGCTATGTAGLSTGAGLTSTTTDGIVVSPGADGTFTASFDQQQQCSLTPGATYNVKIYTKAGNVYSINLPAK